MANFLYNFLNQNKKKEEKERLDEINAKIKAWQKEAVAAEEEEAKQSQQKQSIVDSIVNNGSTIVYRPPPKMRSHLGDALKSIIKDLAVRESYNKGYARAVDDVLHRIEDMETNNVGMMTGEGMRIIGYLESKFKGKK